MVCHRCLFRYADRQSHHRPLPRQHRRVPRLGPLLCERLLQPVQRAGSDHHRHHLEHVNHRPAAQCRFLYRRARRPQLRLCHPRRPGLVQPEPRLAGQRRSVQGFPLGRLAVRQFLHLERGDARGRLSGRLAYSDPRRLGGAFRCDERRYAPRLLRQLAGTGREGVGRCPAQRDPDVVLLAR